MCLHEKVEAHVSHSHTTHTLAYTIHMLIQSHTLCLMDREPAFLLYYRLADIIKMILVIINILLNSDEQVFVTS